jgi:hypothetical protein
MDGTIGRPTKDNINMDLKEQETVDWIYTTQDRDQKQDLVNSNKPLGYITREGI